MERLDGANFRLDRILGRGSFGEVILGRSLVNGDAVALKRMAKINSLVTMDVRESFHQEIKAASILGSHNGIADVKGFFESSKHFWIVLEYVEGITLFEFLEGRGLAPLLEQEAKCIFVQLVNAIAHAHRRGVAHLDIKCDNIMIGSKLKTKLIDWGLSSLQPQSCTKKCGSAEYAPPEMWCRDSPTYDAALADVFSLGVVLFALLFGKFPYSPYNHEKMREGNQVLPPDLSSETVSQLAKELVLSMIDPLPSSRISVNDILEHEWIKDVLPAPCDS